MKIFSWDYKFELLKKYVYEHGELPDKNYIENNIRIGDWFLRQLYVINKDEKDENGYYRYKTNIISKENADRLLQLVNNYKKEEKLSFDDIINLYKEYVAKTNNKLIKLDEEYKGFKIGRWFYNIRKSLVLGEKQDNGDITYKSYRLKKEQVDILNSLDLDLEYFNREEKWNIKYNLTIEYIKTNNKLPSSFVNYKGVNLGQWVNSLRTTYNKGERLEDGSIRYASNKITKEQLKKLEKIGMFRKIGNNRNLLSDKWDEKLNLLIEYLNNHNNEYPTINYPELFNWVNSQRTLRNRLLKDESIKYNKNYKEYKKRIQILESINFLWNQPSIDKWRDNYNLLLKYLKEHNNIYPEHNKYYEGVDLNNWLNLQRTIFNNGTELEDGTIKYKSWVLNKDKINKLNSLENFVWVYKRKKYNSEKIEDTLSYNCKKRLLLLKLEKVLLETKKEFNSKEEIDLINNDFIKTI